MIEVKEIDEKKIDENYRFRTFLKAHADEETLDKQFKELHEKYFKTVDCSKCRNCCKKLGISMSEEELDNICEYYRLDKQKLKNTKLKEKYVEYVANPCPFLNEDNSCQIEECLPYSCREYPYTDKEERLESLLTVVQNSKICPVVYNIMEDLKKIYNFRSR